MYSQNLQKQQRFKRVKGQLIAGPGRHYIDIKTGAGFGDSLKGIFSKLAPMVAPLVKKLTEDPALRQQVVDMGKQGVQALTKVLDSKIGKSESRTKAIKAISDAGIQPGVEEGTKLLDQFLSKGINSKSKKKSPDDMIDDLLKGAGLNYI